MAAASIGAPSGRSSSACGYCSPPEKRSSPPTSSHHAAGLSATLLSCNVYQAMIDHGWRRSGTYCYKPDLRPSCCPNYTIRLDALAFKPSKSQRKLVNRWNRFILDGREKERMPLDVPIKHHQAPKKNRNPLPFSLSSAIHESEASSAREGRPAHRFEVVLEPPSYTDAKYALFEKYLRDIHHDSTSPDGFERFLVDSPLDRPLIPYSTSPPPSHLPIHYGSYHQLYKLDGELIAMAVLDILPHCVSSVFFMYNKTWEEFSFGKLSVLREASLAREMHDAGAPRMGYLYMGFYIHSCPKMRYKGEYSPSYLADPEEHTWHPLEGCLPLLNKYRYACFSDPSHCNDSVEVVEDEDPPGLSDGDAEDINIMIRREGKSVVLPVIATDVWEDAMIRNELLMCIHGLGNVWKEVIFRF